MLLRYFIAVVVWAFTFSATGHALTIGFDDVDASLGDVSLDTVNPYQGFTWTNFSAYTSVPGFPGFDSGIVSAPNAAFSGGELLNAPIIGTIKRAGGFDFVSAALGSANYDRLGVTAQGRRGGSLLFTQGLTVDTSGAQLVTFNFLNVDEVDFFATAGPATSDPFLCGPVNCTQFTLDDVVVIQRASTSVPEPSALALFGLGVALLRYRRWASRTVQFTAPLSPNRLSA